MRLISSLFIIIATMEVAGAHTLDGDHNLAEQLGHQLLGTHHLPVTLILIVAGLTALWMSWQKFTSRNKQ